MMSVLVFADEEEVRLDFDVLSRFCSACEPTHVEEALCQAMEALARELALAEAGWRSNDAHACLAALVKVKRLAIALGMTVLARCAGDCRICLSRGDVAATAATIARLMRLGETSLYALWTGEAAGA